MKASSPATYLRTKVLTASQGELRLMLFDGAIQFASQAKEGLLKRDYEAVYNGCSRCQAILMELMNALRPEHDPELCKRLSALYTFLYLRLVHASSQRDPAIFDEVLKLLRYERETWSMLLDRLSQENRAAGNLNATPDARPPIPPANPDATRGLVGGMVSVRA